MRQGHVTYIISFIQKQTNVRASGDLNLKLLFLPVIPSTRRESQSTICISLSEFSAASDVMLWPDEIVAMNERRRRNETVTVNLYGN